MAKISSHIAKELYKVEIKSTSGNTLIADEPVENGGKNLGFSPHELLISALAACTNATLRMYADRKQWDLQEVKTNIDLLADESGQKTILNRQIELIGNLSDEQKERLMTVANKCPLHKILSNPIEINTTGV
ncbi:OsmC-like protein [compost metagenome]